MVLWCTNALWQQNHWNTHIPILKDDTHAYILLSKLHYFFNQKIYILFQATEPTLISRPHNSYKRWEFLNKKPQAKYKLGYELVQTSQFSFVNYFVFETEMTVHGFSTAEVDSTLNPLHCSKVKCIWGKILVYIQVILLKIFFHNTMGNTPL